MSFELAFVLSCVAGFVGFLVGCKLDDSDGTKVGVGFAIGFFIFASFILDIFV